MFQIKILLLLFGKWLRRFAEVGGKKLIFEEATKAESASFNLMQNSSLTSEKIEALGWSAQFDMLSGARRTLNSMF
mgnify:FL=1